MNRVDYYSLFKLLNILSDEKIMDIKKTKLFKHVEESLNKTPLDQVDLYAPDGYSINLEIRSTKNYPKVVICDNPVDYFVYKTLVGQTDLKPFRMVSNSVLKPVELLTKKGLLNIHHWAQIKCSIQEREFINEKYVGIIIKSLNKLKNLTHYNNSVFPYAVIEKIEKIDYYEDYYTVDELRILGANLKYLFVLGEHNMC